MEYFGWTESDSRYEDLWIHRQSSISSVTHFDKSNNWRGLGATQVLLQKRKKSLDRLYSLCVVCSSFDQSLSNNLERRIYEQGGSGQ